MRLPTLALLAMTASTASTATAAPLEFTVTNPSDRHASAVVTLSMPVAPGLVRDGLPRGVVLAGRPAPAQARVVTRHADGSIRRMTWSFAVDLGPRESTAGACDPTRLGTVASPGADDGAIRGFPTKVYVATFRPDGERIELVGSQGERLAVIRPFGPALGDAEAPTMTILDAGPHLAWMRWTTRGAHWSREVDVRIDELGEIRLVHRLQHRRAGNAWTPDFGFEVVAPEARPIRPPGEPIHLRQYASTSRLADHPELVASLRLAGGGDVAIANPLALRQNRGTFEAVADAASVTVRSSRVEPVDALETSGLMIQEGQWRVSELMIRPGGAEELASRIDAPIAACADWRAYDAVYHTGPPLATDDAWLKLAVEKHVEAMRKMSVDGDDWGNMTSWSPRQKSTPINSMVRYNHCQYVWEDFFRTGDPRLHQIARDWSENYRNLTVYWGPQQKYYGGSRRGRALRDEPGSPHGPGSYMVRFDYALDYVIKGFHNFWLAYEESGDPRFREAAVEQARWAAANVHCDRGEMRNVGVIVDFVKLYEYTGDKSYLDDAVRLWEEFQTRQGPDLLFTQSGKPAVGDDLYIHDDAFGYRHPFVKPYIVQYATNALPHLLRHRPDDRRLRDTIVALNDWMARVQSPGGGWGYPAPASARLFWRVEYDHGLMLACQVEPKDSYLDAVARDLRPKMLLLRRHGEVAAGLVPWETRAGIGAAEQAKMYKLAGDRDRSRDFSAGQVHFHHSPDSTVYFQEVLRRYLRHRDASTLLETDAILRQIERLPTTLD